MWANHPFRWNSLAAELHLTLIWGQLVRFVRWEGAAVTRGEASAEVPVHHP